MNNVAVWGNIVTFKEIEAWRLLFSLEESKAGCARTVYDSWFSGLVLRLSHSIGMPIEDKLRNLIAARLPLSGSVNWTTAKEDQEEMDRIFMAPMHEVASLESFALACDCLRVPHEIRDLLRR